jgi:hypothetical protein
MGEYFPAVKRVRNVFLLPLTGKGLRMRDETKEIYRIPQPANPQNA